ncbi:hypothetical protein [Niabella hirudinis]|uniref:hypothetical protein n=1 Tax=Niabella hirudinis TaxID=1285929 RepID=UPI003EBF7323
MAEVTLIYDPKNALAKKTLNFILSLGIFKKAERKNAIDISLKEIEKGEINTYKSIDAFFKKIKADV